MKKFKERMEFRPLLSLIVILLICGILSGGSFFSLQIVDGHLYGRLIDILRNGSRYMVLAIGMTMVLATGGTDISVGSVMAISGALAGMGGAFMSMGYMSSFNTNMTAGRGFIALAAEAMGRGEPIGTMLTSLLFGFADALANNMQSLGLPQELVAMTPYVFTVVGLAIYAASTLKRNRKKLE